MSLNTKPPTKTIDYLTEDSLIPRQNYVLLSFLSPEGIKNTTMRGVKVRGVYATKEEAAERGKELQTEDPNFDISVGEVGKWLPWDPDPNSAKDQVYQEKELNDLMKGYNDNQVKAKKMQDQRKSDMIVDGALEHKQNSSGPSVNNSRERLQKKLEMRKMDGKSKQDQLPTKDNTVSDADVLGRKEKERLSNNEQLLDSQRNKVKDIDSKLNNIRELYKKLNDTNKSSSSYNLV